MVKISLNQRMQSPLCIHWILLTDIKRGKSSKRLIIISLNRIREIRGVLNLMQRLFASISCNKLTLKANLRIAKLKPATLELNQPITMSKNKILSFFQNRKNRIKKKSSLIPMTNFHKCPSAIIASCHPLPGIKNQRHFFHNKMSMKTYRETILRNWKKYKYLSQTLDPWWWISRNASNNSNF